MAPAWAAAGDALLEGLRRAAHAFLPDLRSMGNAQAVLVFLGHLLIGAVVAASMAIAHRVTPAARRRTGAGS